MASDRDNVRAAAVLIENLAAAGVRDVCLSPGSRSAPLALAVAQHPGLRRHVITDERAAAYFALGTAKASGLPAAVLSTSGTAAANFAPGVAEASLARVPLLVITADRPTELRDSGAAQTIRQSGLFAAHACWSVDAAVPDASWPFERYFAALACRAVAAARRSRAPVHVNVPFREPLWSKEELAGLQRWSADALGQPSVRFESAAARLDDAWAAALASRLATVERGLLVCGPGTAELGDTDAFVELARALGWPVLADPLSGLRFGGLRSEGAEHVLVDAYDVLLRSPELRRKFRPDLVLRFGALPISKAVVQFLAEQHPSAQIAVWPGGAWSDPDFLVTEVIESEPAAFASALAAQLAALSRQRRGGDRHRAWAHAWTATQSQARAGLTHAMDSAAGVFEGALARTIVEALPDGGVLFVGNSLPVRALDTFAAATKQRIRVLANRGANGIDGVTATALGAASSSDGPCVLFTGDLSFLHDIGALQIAHRERISLTIVVANNDGGGIFSFLPRPASEGLFEELFATPHGLSLAGAVEMCGGSRVTVSTCDALARALRSGVAQGGLRMIEVATERETTVRLQSQCVELALADCVAAARERS